METEGALPQPPIAGTGARKAGDEALQHGRRGSGLWSVAIFSSAAAKPPTQFTGQERRGPYRFSEPNDH